MTPTAQSAAAQYPAGVKGLCTAPWTQGDVLAGRAGAGHADQSPVGELATPTAGALRPAHFLRGRGARSTLHSLDPSGITYRAAVIEHVVEITIDNLLWSRLVALPSGCWIWTGRRDRKGYGRLQFAGRDYKAHRFAYELLIGSIPAGLHLDHLCGNTSCANPLHMEPVTARENVLRQRARIVEGWP